MKKEFLALLLLCAVAVGLYSYKPAQQKAVAVEVDVQNQLVDDSGKFHLMVVVPANWNSDAKSQNVLRWFKTDPQLQGIASQTHYQVFAANSRLFGDRYLKYLGPNLSVNLADSTGKVLYRVSQDNIPDSPEALACELSLYSQSKAASTTAGGRIFCGPFCRPKPAPVEPPVAPGPKVDVDVNVNKEPEIPDKKPAVGAIPIGVAIGAGIVAFLLAMAFKANKKFGGGL